MSGIQLSVQDTADPTRVLAAGPDQQLVQQQQQDDSQQQGHQQRQQPAPGAKRHGKTGPAPLILVARPLPRVLLVHCGGTMGMDAQASFVQDVEGHMVLKQVGLGRPLMVAGGHPMAAVQPNGSHFAALEQGPHSSFRLWLRAQRCNLFPSVFPPTPQGTGGQYHKPGKSEALRPGKMLGSLLSQVPELKSFGAWCGAQA